MSWHCTGIWRLKFHALQKQNMETVRTVKTIEKLSVNERRTDIAMPSFRWTCCHIIGSLGWYIFLSNLFVALIFEIWTILLCYQNQVYINYSLALWEQQKKNSCLGFLTVQQVDCCKKGGIFSQKSCEKLFSRNVKRIRECQADLGQTSVKTKDWIINYFCGEKKAKVWRLNIVIDYNRAMRWTRTINTNHQSKVSKLVDLMSMWKKRGKRARKRLNDVSLPYSHDKWPFSDITVGSSYVIQVTTESSRTNARSKLIASHWKINKN